jgi:hypothetical protein
MTLHNFRPHQPIDEIVAGIDQDKILSQLGDIDDGIDIRARRRAAIDAFRLPIFIELPPVPVGHLPFSFCLFRLPVVFSRLSP